MDAIKLLESQHEEVETLFARAEDAPPAEKEDLFIQIADALATHATIEEKLFYPTVKAKSTEDILLESVEEHLAVKRVIADMLDLSPTDDTFDAKLTLLKEQVLHHVKEERTELFPKVKKLLDAEQLEALGQEMMALTDELEGNDPRLQVPNETAEAAHI